METLRKLLVTVLAGAATWGLTSLIVLPMLPLRDLGACLGLLFWLIPPFVVMCITPVIIAARRKSPAFAVAREQAYARSRQRAATNIQIEPFHHQLENVPTFVHKFIANATPPRKDKFETDNEYAARLLPPVNPSQSFYFSLAEKEFLYCVETATATIVSSSYLNEDYGTLRLLECEERSGSSIWTNAFGAQWSVSVVRRREYEIRVYNPKAVTSLLRCSSGYLELSVLLDRSYAQRNEKYLRLVAGVRFIDWTRHTHRSSHERPEFPIGLETYWDQYRLEGYLTTVHLINIDTNEQLRSWRIC